MSALRETILEAGREAAANATHSIKLSLDDPQARPAILAYADTIEAGDPERAKELRHWVLSYQNGVQVPHFDMSQRMEELADAIEARLRESAGLPPAS